MTRPIDDIARIDPVTGEEIPATDEQKAEAIATLREALHSGRVILGPCVKADLARLGISQDEVLADIARFTGGKH